MTPEISIVIPTFNRSALLRGCLDSVVRQSFANFEVVVIDDGSSDDTADVVRNFDDRVRYIYQENRGIPGALNRGIEESAGDFIGFLASDDELLPGAIELQASVLRENPRVGLVFGQAWQVNETGEAESLRKPDFATGPYIHEGNDEVKKLLFYDHITCSTVMVRRSALDVVGGFDPAYNQVGEDWDLWLRIASRFQVAYIDQPIGRYLKHSDNTSMKLDLDYLEYQRFRMVDAVFADEHVATGLADVREAAYLEQYRYLAAMSYKLGHMARSRRLVRSALRRFPDQVVRPAGIRIMYIGIKASLPSPVLAAGRWVAGRMRKGEEPGRSRLIDVSADHSLGPAQEGRPDA